MSTIKYDTHHKLSRIHVPVLILHSRSDGLIGFHHAEKNLAAANDPKMLWEIAGKHNQFLEAGRRRYLEGLEKFLATMEAVNTRLNAAELPGGSQIQ